jgi:hypothetical protein
MIDWPKVNLEAEAAPQQAYRITSLFLTSARFSKFVLHRGTLRHKLRKPKGTSNVTILVPLVDLKFLIEPAVAGAGTSNRRH